MFSLLYTYENIHTFVVACVRFIIILFFTGLKTSSLFCRPELTSKYYSPSFFLPPPPVENLFLFCQPGPTCWKTHFSFANPIPPIRKITSHLLSRPVSKINSHLAARARVQAFNARCHTIENTFPFQPLYF